MAAVAGTRIQIGVKEFGRDVDVPYDDTAQLMYYINCMCVVLDLNSEPGLSRLRDYKNYQRLTEGEKAALLLLCLALNPIELNGKCIFPVRRTREGFPNQFLQLNATQTDFVASNNVLVGGQRRKVTSIMLYTNEWIHQCYLNPLENLAGGQQGPPRRAIPARAAGAAERAQEQQRVAAREAAERQAAQRRAAERQAAQRQAAERQAAQRREENRNNPNCIIQ